jgi:hypothetical protein
VTSSFKTLYASPRLEQIQSSLEDLHLQRLAVIMSEKNLPQNGYPSVFTKTHWRAPDSDYNVHGMNPFLQVQVSKKVRSLVDEDPQILSLKLKRNLSNAPKL